MAENLTSQLFITYWSYAISRVYNKVTLHDVLWELDLSSLKTSIQREITHFLSFLYRTSLMYRFLLLYISLLLYYHPSMIGRLKCDGDCLTVNEKWNNNQQSGLIGHISSLQCCWNSLSIYLPFHSSPQGDVHPQYGCEGPATLCQPSQSSLPSLMPSPNYHIGTWK